MSEARKEPQYVDTPERLSALVESVSRSAVVVLDTEFIPEDTYEPRLCLMQVGTAEGIAIVDPLAVADLEALWKALTDASRELVALGARQEVLFCMRGAGRPPAKFVDLQIAAGLVGYGYPLSHTRLIERTLGVHVKGGEAFTDWRKRPLSPKQLHYAADDVRHLLAARDALAEEARRMRRTEWVETECRRMVERIVAGDAEEGWRRVAGSSGLDKREAAVMRELWRWRDASARSTNRPAKRILPDHLMVGIARRKPARIDDIQALRGMERVPLRRCGTEILGAVQRGLATPETECPSSGRRVDPPQVGTLAQFLSAVAHTLAAQNRVDGTLLATSADLQELVRWKLGLLGAEERPVVLEGWRGTILAPLVEILDGKRHVRVTDVKSKHPLAFENGAVAEELERR